MEAYMFNWLCLALLNISPFLLLLITIGHFRVRLSLHFKASLSAKSLLWKSVFIHNKDFALSVALKWRLRWTRKWPILLRKSTMVFSPQESENSEQKPFIPLLMLMSWRQRSRCVTQTKIRPKEDWARLNRLHPDCLRNSSQLKAF